MDTVMHCTTLLSHSSFSQQILVSFVMEIHATSIDFLTPMMNGNPSRVNIKQLCGRYKRQCCSLIPAESNSLPHAHAQTIKTYNKHQDSRIKKAQEFKKKTSANSDIQDLPLRYQVYQGILLA
ncbi:hypothetical protein Tco_1513500, partial [Tanacetum coccineum]